MKTKLTVPKGYKFSYKGSVLIDHPGVRDLNMSKFCMSVSRVPGVFVRGKGFFYSTGNGTKLLELTGDKETDKEYLLAHFKGANVAKRATTYKSKSISELAEESYDETSYFVDQKNNPNSSVIFV